MNKQEYAKLLAEIEASRAADEAIRTDVLAHQISYHNDKGIKQWVFSKGEGFGNEVRVLVTKFNDRREYAIRFGHQEKPDTVFPGATLSDGTEIPAETFTHWTYDPYSTGNHNGYAKFNDVLEHIGRVWARLRVQEQTTRLIKCQCSDCGYTVRTTSKWINVGGAPICPVDEIPMEVA